jgi:acyl dehydratase
MHMTHGEAPLPALRRGLYFEEFELGAGLTTASHRITAEEIADFARLTGDDNPLHIDTDAARAAGFGDVIAHGFLIQSLVMGLIAATGVMRGTTIALVGAELRFVAPALAGSAIRAEVTYSAKRLSSNGRSGVLERSVSVLDQNDTLLVTGRLTNVMRLAPAEPGAPS